MMSLHCIINYSTLSLNRNQVHDITIEVSLRLHLHGTMKCHAEIPELTLNKPP